MSVAPFELKCILTDKFDLSKFQIVRNMDWKNDAHTGHLVFAGRAGTHAAKRRGSIVTLLAVSPDDHQFPGTYLLYFCRCGFHSTSRTGASKLRMLTCAATFS